MSYIESYFNTFLSVLEAFLVLFFLISIFQYSTLAVCFLISSFVISLFGPIRLFIKNRGKSKK
jgi:hypothetical protein